jgi:hypothetical protein
MEHMAAYKRFNGLSPIKACGLHGGPTTLADAKLGHHSAKRRKRRGKTAVWGAGEGETSTDRPLLTWPRRGHARAQSCLHTL